MSLAPETSQISRLGRDDVIYSKTVSEDATPHRSEELFAPDHGVERNNIQPINDIDQLVDFLSAAMPGAEIDIDEFKKFIYLHVRNYIEIEYALRTEEGGAAAHVDTYDSDITTEKLSYLMALKKQACLAEIGLIGQESAYDEQSAVAYRIEMDESTDAVNTLQVHKYRVLSDEEIRTILYQDGNSGYKGASDSGRDILVQNFRDDRTPLTDAQIYVKLAEMSAIYQKRRADVAAKNRENEDRSVIKKPKDLDHDPRLDSDTYADIMNAGMRAQESVDVNVGQLVDFSKYGHKPIDKFSESELALITQDFRDNNQLYTLCADKDQPGAATIDMESIFNSVVNNVYSNRQEFERFIREFEYIYGLDWIQDQLDQFDSQFNAQEPNIDSPETDDNQSPVYTANSVRQLARRALGKLRLW